MPTMYARARRVRVGSWLGVGGMVIGGIGVGLLVFFIMVGLLIDSDVNASIVFCFCLLLMFGVAAALWWTHNRYWRALALGLTGFWVVLTLWLVVGALFGTQGMSSEDMDQEKASILASGKPAYYLGEEAEGHDLEWVYPNGEFGAEGFQFGYGTKCEGGDSGCSSYIDVSTYSLSRGYLNPYSEAALARKLRPLGQSKVVTALPPPTQAVWEIVEQRCGPDS